MRHRFKVSSANRPEKLVAVLADSTQDAIAERGVGDVIKLGLMRKQKRRAEKEAQAQANRILHGQPKDARKSAKMMREDMDRHLDGHKMISSSNRQEDDQ